MYNPFSIEGKTIFITGASSGIGRATAIECSRMGAVLFITGRNPKGLQETYDKLEGNGHVQILADLSDSLNIPDIVDQLSPLDGAVHCAGFTNMTPFQFIGEKDLNAIMQVNFTAPALLSQALVKTKKLKKGASVVFISSISGVYCSSVAGSMYSASKGAVNGLVKGMALDLAPRKIRVNSVTPGMIDTHLFSEGAITEELFREDIKRYPLSRYGQPEEVAHAVIYLLSDATQWITGSNLLIDGGYTLL
ncbi:MAG: SDR family oxidoreductase [Bacteroidota bacterium]|nr:SDR family oxidoreductase [Bacteroidota bacterium]